MAGEMLLDLAFGLGHEAEADCITGTPGDEPDAEGARIPERVEQALVGAEFAQALACPREMVGFFARGPFESAAQRRVARAQRLGAVECLRAHLADMIDAHQCARQPTVSVGQRGRLAARRSRSLRVACAADGAQRLVGGGQQFVEERGGRGRHFKGEGRRWPRISQGIRQAGAVVLGVLGSGSGSRCAQDNIKAFFDYQAFPAPGPSGAIRTTSAEGVVPDLPNEGDLRSGPLVQPRR